MHSTTRQNGGGGNHNNNNNKRKRFILFFYTASCIATISSSFVLIPKSRHTNIINNNNIQHPPVRRFSEISSTVENDISSPSDENSRKHSNNSNNNNNNTMKNNRGNNNNNNKNNRKNNNKRNINNSPAARKQQFRRRNYSNTNSYPSNYKSNNNNNNSQYKDEKDRKELDWIVRNTGKILGQDAPEPGTLSQGRIAMVESLMQAWARRSSKRESRAPHVVERLLQRLLKERDRNVGNNNNNNNNNNLVIIDTSLYNTVLDAWSNSYEEGSAERCEEILMRLEDMYYKQGNEDVKPDENSYNAVIKAYVKNGNRKNAVSKIEAIVERMERHYDDSEDIEGEGEGGGGEQQQLPLQEQEPVANVNDDDDNDDNDNEEGTPEGTTLATAATARPNRRSYNLLLYALANSSLKDAPVRADRILQKMLKRYLHQRQHHVGNPNQLAHPDINSFNQVLGAWARGRNPGFESKLNSTLQQLLNMSDDLDVKPDTDTFNAVLGGWLKSDRPDAIPNIEEVLKVMEDSYRDGNEAAKPDRITVNTLMAAFAKDGSSDAFERSVEISRAMERKYRIKPDQISHNIVVDSWCKSRKADAPERVMELLEDMERRFQRTHKSLAMPDGYTYSSVIGCLVKFQRPDAPEMAEDLLERMKNLHVNHGGDPVGTSVYNAVINAWASSDSDYASVRVREILKEMHGDDPKVPNPNRITYNTVMKAMANGRDGDAEYSEQMLRQLEKKGREDPHFLPDSYSYSSVISAYGRSSNENKAEKALEMLKRQIASCNKEGNKAARPRIHSFNAALNACAFCKGSRNCTARAFQIAVQIYDLLQKYTQADQTTYGTLLRATASLLPRSDPNRERMVESFFRQACETGSVGRLVIGQMKFAATPEQHFRLIGHDIMKRLDPSDLPLAWTRNVKENPRYNNNNDKR